MTQLLQRNSPAHSRCLNVRPQRFRRPQGYPPSDQSHHQSRPSRLQERLPHFLALHHPSHFRPRRYLHHYHRRRRLSRRRPKQTVATSSEGNDDTTVDAAPVATSVPAKIPVLKLREVPKASR